MPDPFSPNECVDMLLIFGECHKNSREAARIYRERFPDRVTPSHMTFLRVEAKMRTGQFPSSSKHAQHLAPVRTEEMQINVLAYSGINPHTSVRILADEVGTSKSTVHRILQSYKYHPFKIHLLQELRPADYERRLEFIAIMQVILHEDPDIVNKIMWTDESRFHNNGVINRHNSHYWASENPHWVRETHFQTVWGINVWCGLFNGRIIGPYFFEGTLTGERYLEFLQRDIPELMAAIPRAERDTMWWQQDGAPAHNARIVTDHLNNVLPDRWIGTTGSIRWPPRSPDLSPLDYFLWGYLKAVVYNTPPRTLEDLKNKIRQACNDITIDMIRNSNSRELIRRFEACVMSTGGHFEQYL